MEDQFLFETTTDDPNAASAGGGGGSGKVKFDRLTIKTYSRDDAPDALALDDAPSLTEPADYDSFL